MNDTANQFDRFGKVRNLLMRYRWRFVLAVLGAALMVLLVSLALPRKYEAEAIFERHSDLVMNELANRGRATQLRPRLNKMVQADLAGRPALIRVVERLALLKQAGADDQNDFTRQELINHLHRNLRVTLELSTSNLERVRVTLIDEDPKRARAVVNELVRIFIEDHEKEWKESLDDAGSFFREQQIACEQQIEALEKQRVEFELKHAELLPDEAASLKQRIADTEAQLLEARQKQQAAERWLDTLARRLESSEHAPRDTTSVIMRPNPELDAIDNRLAKYRDQVDHLLTVERMTANHPTVRSMESKIAELQERRDTLPTEVVSERRMSSSSPQSQRPLELAEAQSHAEAAAAAVVLAEEQLAKLNSLNTRMYPVQSQYRRLARDIDHLQRQADFWDDNVRRVMMANAAETDQRGVSMRFTHPCGELNVPSSPDPAQVMFAALVVGIAAGVLALLVSDRTDRTFTDLHEATRELGLPILGATGPLITARAARWQAFTHRVVYPVCILLMGAALSVAAYTTYVALRTPQTGDNVWHQAFQRLVAGETPVKVADAAVNTPPFSAIEEGARFCTATSMD